MRVGLQGWVGNLAVEQPVSKMEEVIGSVGWDCRCPELSGGRGRRGVMGLSENMPGLWRDKNGRDIRRTGGIKQREGGLSSHISKCWPSGSNSVNKLVTAALLPRTEARVGKNTLAHCAQPQPLVLDLFLQICPPQTLSRKHAAYMTPRQHCCSGCTWINRS